MELNPFLFAVIAYGVAIIIALCVAFIIKIIVLIVRREGKGAVADNAQEDS